VLIKWGMVLAILVQINITLTGPGSSPWLRLIPNPQVRDPNARLVLLNITAPSPKPKRPEDDGHEKNKGQECPVELGV
jgi:hypothetical protein